MTMNPDNPRYVAKTVVGPFEVSTVKLDFDHNNRGSVAEPEWFETMVFHGMDETRPFHDVRERYATHADALAGHAAIVVRVRAHVKGQKP